MYPICYRRVSGGYLQPEPTMDGDVFLLPCPVIVLSLANFLSIPHAIYEIRLKCASAVPAKCALTVQDD